MVRRGIRLCNHMDKKCYPTDENMYDLGIIGVIVHGHVINICSRYVVEIYKGSLPVTRCIIKLLIFEEDKK